jgi:hypothetical protein
MTELVTLVLAAYCARTWKLLCDIQHGVSLPFKAMDEANALREELGRFFADPAHNLIPADLEVVTVPDPLSVIEQPVTETASPVTIQGNCCQCDGTGQRRSNYIGGKSFFCVTCNGTGHLTSGAIPTQ